MHRTQIGSKFYAGGRQPCLRCAGAWLLPLTRLVLQDHLPWSVTTLCAALHLGVQQLISSLLSWSSTKPCIFGYLSSRLSYYFCADEVLRMRRASLIFELIALALAGGLINEYQTARRQASNCGRANSMLSESSLNEGIELQGKVFLKYQRKHENHGN